MYCHNCGKQLPDGAKFCNACGAAQNAAPAPEQEQYIYTAPAPEPRDYTAQPAYQQAPAVQPPKERVGRGIMGAFLGSLAGVASIVILNQLGYVAALSGVVMSACTLMGYARFGKRLSGKGIIISIVIILFMILVGEAISNGVLVLRAGSSLGVFFKETMRYFSLLFYLIETGGKAKYIAEVLLPPLLQQYGFAALGAVPVIISSIKNRDK